MSSFGRSPLAHTEGLPNRCPDAQEWPNLYPWAGAAILRQAGSQLYVLRCLTPSGPRECCTIFDLVESCVCLVLDTCFQSAHHRSLGPQPDRVLGRDGPCDIARPRGRQKSSERTWIEGVDSAWEYKWLARRWLRGVSHAGRHSIESC